MKKSNYQFHFIITKTIKGYIDFLKKELQFKKDIDLYDYMLEIMSKNLPQLKGLIGNHKSEYALIDLFDDSRIHKYARLKEKNYIILKKWHSKFNEYGMSTILRDIIKLFYEGVLKYGVNKYIEMICRKLNFKKIWIEIKDVLTHMMRNSEKKAALFSYTIQNLPFLLSKK